MSEHDQYKRHLFSEKPLYQTKLVKQTDVDFGPNDRWQMSSPDAVVQPIREFLADSPKERFLSIMLATNNSVIGLETVSTGSLSSSVVEPREVFRPAILANAAALICAHNHPSGNPEPSRADIKITRQLSDAGDTLDMPLYDHLIITSRDYTSLADRGVL